MTTPVLPYQTPTRLTKSGRLMPGWRDVAFTQPGAVVGLVTGTLLSLLYFSSFGDGWLAIILGCGKLAVGSAMTIMDRWRWVGFGLLVSIFAGIVLFWTAFLGRGWCC